MLSKRMRFYLAFLIACGVDLGFYMIVLFETMRLNYMIYNTSSPYYGEYFASPVMKANAIGALSLAAVFFMSITLAVVFVFSVLPSLFTLRRERRANASVQ